MSGDGEGTRRQLATAQYGKDHTPLVVLALEGPEQPSQAPAMRVSVPPVGPNHHAEQGLGGLRDEGGGAPGVLGVAPHGRMVRA